MKFLPLLTAVCAHFEMLRPIPRIVGEMDDQRIAPCAGAVLPANRAPFLISNNSLELTFYWNGNNDVYFGFGENPSRFPYKVGNLRAARAGKTYTVPLDFSNVPGLVNGAYGTIQVVCHQPKFDVYQCADVIVAGVPQPPNTTTPAVESTSAVETTITTVEVPVTVSSDATTTATTTYLTAAQTHSQQ
jgi:hypothetical protein